MPIELERRKSGLLVPPDQPKESERKYKPLELRFCRDEAQRLLSELLNLTEVRGGAFCGHPVARGLRSCSKIT